MNIVKALEIVASVIALAWCFVGMYNSDCGGNATEELFDWLLDAPPDLVPMRIKKD